MKWICLSRFTHRLMVKLMLARIRYIFKGENSSKYLQFCTKTFFQQNRAAVYIRDKMSFVNNIGLVIRKMLQNITSKDDVVLGMGRSGNKRVLSWVSTYRPSSIELSSLLSSSPSSSKTVCICTMKKVPSVNFIMTTTRMSCLLPKLPVYFILPACYTKRMDLFMNVYLPIYRSSYATLAVIFKFWKYLYTNLQRAQHCLFNANSCLFIQL